MDFGVHFGVQNDSSGGQVGTKRPPRGRQKPANSKTNNMQKALQIAAKTPLGDASGPLIALAWEAFGRKTTFKQRLQNLPKMRPKTVPKMKSKWDQNGRPKWQGLAQEGGQERPRREHEPKRVRSMPREPPRQPQECPKRAQESPNSAQRVPQEGPKRAPAGPRETQQGLKRASRQPREPKLSPQASSGLGSLGLNPTKGG